jgi:hypothetical protein
MNGKAILLTLGGLVFFFRAAGCYMNKDMIGALASFAIGVCWIFGAVNAGGDKPQQPQGVGTPIGLFLLLTLFGVGGLAWWQFAGPGASGGGSSSPKTQKAEVIVPQGPSREEIQKKKDVDGLVSSTTIHRAEFTVKDYESTITLNAIEKQLAALPGVIGIGTDQFAQDGKMVARMGVVYDSSLTDMKKLVSPVEFGQKVKLVDIDDATISGAAAKSLLHVASDGTAHFALTAPPSAEKRTEVVAEHIRLSSGWHVAGFRMIPETSDTEWSQKVRASLRAHKGWYIAPQTQPDPAMVHVIYQPADSKAEDLAAVIKNAGIRIQAQDDHPCDTPAEVAALEAAELAKAEKARASKAPAVAIAKKPKAKP